MTCLKTWRGGLAARLVIVTLSIVIILFIAVTAQAAKQDKDDPQVSAIDSGYDDDEDLGLSQEFTDCMDNTKTEPDANRKANGKLSCLQSELKNQEDRLERIYKQALNGIAPKQRSKLPEVQHSWLQYRNADCEFQGLLYPDQQGAIQTAQCLLRSTAKRAQELEDLLDM